MTVIFNHQNEVEITTDEEYLVIESHDSIRGHQRIAIAIENAGIFCEAVMAELSLLGKPEL